MYAADDNEYFEYWVRSDYGTGLQLISKGKSSLYQSNKMIIHSDTKQSLVDISVHVYFFLHRLQMNRWGEHQSGPTTQLSLNQV